jgi:hypothetical protein
MPWIEQEGKKELALEKLYIPTKFEGLKGNNEFIRNFYRPFSNSLFELDAQLDEMEIAIKNGMWL